jgi:peptidoglycan/xylan/chitin deacetylase (PgdA/CDA1 family)
MVALSALQRAALPALVRQRRRNPPDGRDTLSRGGIAFLLLWLALSAPAWGADSAVVLVYQRIGEERQHPESSVSRAQFEAHLATLKSGGFAVLSLREIAGALSAGRALPPRAVALAFDNGFASVFRVARPLLSAAGLPYAVFVASDGLDQGGADLLGWDELRTLKAEGVEIGTRGAANRPLWRLDAAGRTGDLNRAIARFEAELGGRPVLLAYPDGEYDGPTQASALEAGFEAAFALASGPWHAGSDRYALPRFELNGRYADPDRVALIARTLPLAITGLEPAGPVLAATPEVVAFTVGVGAESLDGLACYQSGGGRLALERSAARRVKLLLARPFGRGHDNRINCTLPAPDGALRWLGLQFVVP